MTGPKTMIVEVSGADSAALASVKPGYGEEQVAERLRWLKEDVEGTWLLLKSQDTAIGWCVAVWSGKKSHPAYPDMQDLFLRPQHRNQGHGTRLISEVERRTKDRGHARLGLAVNPDDNPSARRLYERLGYRHDGRKKYLDGVYDGYEDWVIDMEKAVL